MSAERLYYDDTFLRRFRARVTAARAAEPDGEGERWEIALDRTAFYPTSGGQPFDTGWLRLTANGGGEIAVLAVFEDDDGEVWHAVRQPLAAGAAVEGEIDWERRLDHMQQHTGQHLLSAVFARELQAATVSFHMGASVSNIDLACAPLPEAALQRVELAVNRIIAEDRRVRARVVERAEAEALLAEGKLRKLPERAGAMRLIEIEDCDLNACGGTHARSTGQIGGLWLRGTENISRGARVHFACGLRAVRAGRADAAELRRATEALSVGAGDLAAAIEKLQAAAKTAAKTQQLLREELAEAEATRLLAGVEAGDGLRLVSAECRDRDRDFVRLLASRLAAAAPRTVAILSSGEPDRVRVVLARSRDLSFDCGALMKQAMAARGLRGGGSADMAQGEVAAEQAAGLRAELGAELAGRAK